MKCEHAREAVSASLDGEGAPVDAAAVEAHLAGCASCRAWVSGAHRVTRRVRVDRVGVVPDRSERIVAAVLADRTSRGMRGWTGLARIGLAVLAAAQVVVFALTLVVDGHVQALHPSHEVDTFDLALAAGFLTAARRPSRARGMLTLVGVAAAGLLVTAGLDVVDGGTKVVEEAPHLLTAAGWLLLYRLARVSREGPYGPSAQEERISVEQPNPIDHPSNAGKARSRRGDTDRPIAVDPAA